MGFDIVKAVIGGDARQHSGESRMGRTEIIGDWDRRKKSEVLGNFTVEWRWGECGTGES